MSGKAKTWGVAGLVVAVFVAIIFASGGHKPLPLAFNHERCGTVTAADDADAEAARAWCDAMPDGVISAASADGPLLTLWVERSMAEQMLGDPATTREMLSKMGGGRHWKDAGVAIGGRSDHVRRYEVAKFDTAQWREIRPWKLTIRGDVVTIGRDR